MYRRHRPVIGASMLLAMIAFASTLALASPAHAARVFIDPGHGGIYPGAVYAGIAEKTVNLQIALRLRSELVARGHTVTMSRTSDVTVGPTDRAIWRYDSETDTWDWFADGTTRYSDGVPRDDLQARCDRANAAGADIFISIHNNASITSAAQGYETYSAAEDRLGATLATFVHREVIDAIPLRDRGAKTTGFYVIRWSHMPAILAECGFLSNASDRAYITSASGQATIARAIADGVDGYFASDPYRPIWPRVAGDRRYGTAAGLSLDGWPDGAGTVLLATGENWPDALASAPLSHALDAPLLLTGRDSLPDETAAELARLMPERLIVLGGTDAVSPEVAAAAARAASIEESATERIQGANRYETAALIADRVGVPESGQVCVVTGSGPADAVSISSYAGANEIPVLLVRPDDMSAPTAAFAAAHADTWRSTLVIGGTSVITPALESTLPTATRLAGPARYATNTAIVQTLFTDPTVHYVANGEAYPDCLTAGVRGAKSVSPILLVQPRTLSNHTRLYIENHETRIESFTMVGGSTVLPYLHDWMLDKALR
ncbi:MAG TPA: hypothetical protein DCP20_05685 [Coriobacteriia bacterium]|nr:hypothetical protein [Coriobacteriia bacterium]